ncbi:response regulator [Maricaulis sp. CAU 1757]
MADSDYARASVLLFDPIHVNQRTTRYALHEMGFRQISCVTSLTEFKSALSETSPALVVADSSGSDADVFKLVRSVRRNEVGSNPFAVFLLTTWSRDTNHIRKAIECGADDVIVRPFSTMFAEERVRTLIKNRKDFIVTSDYIGPDRRKDDQRGTDAAPISVPNFLQAIVENDTTMLNEANGWVKEAKAMVANERVRRVAMRIVVTVELHLDAKEGASVIPLDVRDLQKSSAELRSLINKAGRQEAGEVVAALMDQIVSLGTGEGAKPSTLRLIKELSMGAYAAFANGDSLERSKDEIGRTVGNLRRRLQAKAAMAAQRKAAAQAAAEAQATADDAGQASEPGIKRAAM